MQTFLPHPSYADSARVLDQRRLGKQRVENMQIMSALVANGGWQSHPAVKMWAGYERSLLEYQIAICDEWVHVRGFRDSCASQTVALLYNNLSGGALINQEPLWLGDPDIHLGYQSNLVRKDPNYYGPLFPGVPDDLPYIWPVQ